jgi:hypothetical protein
MKNIMIEDHIQIYSFRNKAKTDSVLSYWKIPSFIVPLLCNLFLTKGSKQINSQ